MNKTKATFFITLSDHWQFLCVLVIAVIIIIVCSVWFLFHTYSQLSAAHPLQQAKLLTITLKEVRSLYTQEVVSIAKRNKLLITHDYENQDGKQAIYAGYWKSRCRSKVLRG